MAHQTRRQLLPAIGGAGLAAIPLVAPRAGGLLPPGITPTPPSERRVGVSYAMWHPSTEWTGERPWGVPELGFYRSNDPAVIRQHAEWMSGANIDFINIDWSNDLGVDPRLNSGPPGQLFLERSTVTLFEVYAGLGRKPQICIMLGDSHAFVGDHSFAALQRKADQVHDQFVANPRYAPLLQTYLGKPLLIVFIGGAGLQPTPPSWSDMRFTVRYMAAFITSPWHAAFHQGLVSTDGYWSWEDVGPPSFTIHDGHPETMTVVAAYRTKNSPGRDGGRVFLNGWAEARQVGPRFVLAGTFNEWRVSEQPSPNLSKDIEPSKEFGFLYLDIVKQQAALLKRGL